MTSQTRRKQRLTTNWNEHPRPGLAVPMADTRFLLFPLMARVELMPVFCKAGKSG